MKSLVGPLVLIGPMGVGKTTIGKKLAHSWGLPFIDTDAAVVSKHGEISKIFEQAGEETFRQFETDALAAALLKPAVVATGGGIVLKDENRRLLDSHNVVYLATDGKHIQTRIQGSKRPLLQNGLSDWKRIYDQRKHLYEEVAKFTLDTSNMPLRAVILAIEEHLK